MTARLNLKEASPLLASDGLRGLVLASSDIVAEGMPDTTAATVPARSFAAAAEAFLSHGGTPGPDARLVGLLPFAADGTALLMPARCTSRETHPFDALRRPVRACRVTTLPSAGDYEESVRRALGQMNGTASLLRKVVLARSLLVEATEDIDQPALLARLGRDPAVTTFAIPLPADSGRQPAALIGATPELLVSRRGDTILSSPLAGSTRRHADAAKSSSAGAALLASAKDRREHALVVEAIADTLTPWCRDLAVETPRIVPTATMLHLGSRISGRLIDRTTPVTTLAATLHPTPAVCGSPRAAARAVIAELETFDRAFFTGAVGWSDASGDGAWYVAIRCAEVSGRTARLFAGAGIVPGSDPAAEAAETSAKFATLLNALGIDERGRPLPEAPA